ncbi:Armadillo repeat-containing protein 7 [Frankliniella fusca]|uniref:Armadillo repeat-containing protein 7 n=1 Tax=Frankliniella fusca TaxID=407009 RepID=A0AAE1HRK7_9NEOP|nr:Armadillo repeat-containing protein 7 [Frankliniella fusca]
MFSTHDRLRQRTGKKGSGRLEYLQELVTEFQDTSSIEAKHQVLANLANFAYDPINYEFLRNLKVIDLFLDQITESDDTLQRFAICGLCNLCPDPENKEYIIHNNGITAVATCLSSPNEQTVLSAIATLMFLITPESKPFITSVEIIECMVRFSSSANPRLRNLANVFLEDYCTPHQVTEVRKQVEIARIPLPSPPPPASSSSSSTS